MMAKRITKRPKIKIFNTPSTNLGVYSDEVIYLNKCVIETFPLIVIQYVVTHEYIHFIQDKYIFPKTYETDWHGESFVKLAKKFGYIFKNDNYTTIIVPDELMDNMKTGCVSKKLPYRLSYNDWLTLGGSEITVIYATNK
jgi:hypothetical protein